MVKRIYYYFVAAVTATIIFLYLLFISGGWSTFFHLNQVESNYVRRVGIVSIGTLNYDSISSRYGEPDNIEILSDTPMPGRYTIYISHGMLTFKFGAANIEEYNDTSKWELYTIKTRNPEHHFGKAKIHVGSTRDEVIQAYSKLDPEYRSAMGNQYYDGYWGQYVSFEYDENDIVTSIEFVD